MCIKVSKFWRDPKNIVFLAHNPNITSLIEVVVASPILIKRKPDPPFQSTSSGRSEPPLYFVFLQNLQSQRNIPLLSCYTSWFTCGTCIPVSFQEKFENLDVKVCHAVSQLSHIDAKEREEKPSKCFNWFINAPKCEQAWWSVKRDVTPVWQSCHSGKDFL